MDINVDFLESTIDTKLNKDLPAGQYIYLKESVGEGELEGYNVWSNGYCEQWGRSSSVEYKSSEIIELPKKYKYANFGIAGASVYEQSSGDKGSSWALTPVLSPQYIAAQLPDSGRTNPGVYQIKYYSGLEQGSASGGLKWVFWRTYGFLLEGEY